MRLLTNAQNGDGAAFDAPAPHPSAGGNRFFTFGAWGTFDGATVGLEIQPVSGADWLDSGIALTAPGAVNVEFKAYRVRGVVSGGGGSEAINAELVG